MLRGPHSPQVAADSVCVFTDESHKRLDLFTERHTWRRFSMLKWREDRDDVGTESRIADCRWTTVVEREYNGQSRARIAL
jgi:hypothetical protein